MVFEQNMQNFHTDGPLVFISAIKIKVRKGDVFEIIVLVIYSHRLYFKLIIFVRDENSGLHLFLKSSPIKLVRIYM